MLLSVVFHFGAITVGRKFIFNRTRPVYDTSTETVFERTKFRCHLRVYRRLSISDRKKQLLCHTNENGNVYTVKPYFATSRRRRHRFLGNPVGFLTTKTKKKTIASVLNRSKTLKTQSYTYST